MARICTAVFLVLTYAVCAANCSFNKVKFEKVMETMKKVINLNNPRVEILVTGRVGVGKSTLINGLVGTDYVKTGISPTSVTKNLEVVDIKKNGVHARIIDTPGFGDLDIADNDTLHGAQELCEDVDLLLLCLDMTNRLDRFSIEEIGLITRMYGHTFWKKGMIVLTQANLIKEKEKFTSLLQEWRHEIRKRIRKVIDPKIAENIPIVPAGFKEPQLHDLPSWLSELWIQGFRRMGLKGMSYMILLNIDRIHGSTEGMKLSQNMYGNPKDQPLIACYMSKDTRYIDPEYLPLLGKLIGGALGSLVSLSVGGATLPIALPAGVYMGKWAGAALSKKFDTAEKAKVHCSDEALIRSLVAAFVEEYPNYKEQLSLE